MTLFPPLNPPVPGTVLINYYQSMGTLNRADTSVPKSNGIALIDLYQLMVHISDKIFVPEHMGQQFDTIVQM